MSEPKIVRVTVEGGVVQNVEVPPGVTVIVHDYDVDDDYRDVTVTPPEEYPTDDNGDPYHEGIYEGGDEPA